MQTIENTLNSILEQVLHTFDLPGLAVGVVREKEIIYAKGFGFQDIRTMEPVKVRSLFHQASISKVFTATAVVQLAEQGQLRLNDALVKYLPGFCLGDERSQAITIEQILSHTSGVPDPEDHDWGHSDDREDALIQRVKNLHFLEMISEPGREFAYSSLGYDVLGALISEVSGEMFESYIFNHIFEPLGMMDSTFIKPDVPIELATLPHIRTPKLVVSDIFPYSRSQAPSGTLQSSILDMCQWAIANLYDFALDDRLNSHRILSPEFHQLLWQPRFSTGQVNDSRQTEIGLGCFLGDYKGLPVVMHDGGDVGFEAEIVLLPEQSVAVVVMANIFPAVTDSITQSVLDVVLGFGDQIPESPLMISLLSTMRDDGLEAAVTQHRQIGGDLTKDDMAFLRNSIFILQEAYRLEDANELTKLSVQLFPESKN
jgi:CubicO group peptidase (beta-lactamase class C family)